MLPSARRRAGALSTWLLCIAIILLFAGSASAAVVGLDFGTKHLKAALVKPGIPLDIVLTKDSKRKEVAAVAFKPNRDSKGKAIAEAGAYPERAYGGDALALQGRLPGEVFPNLKMLLGLQWGEEAKETSAVYQERYPAIQLQQSQELGTTVFKSAAFANDVSPFSVEELVGMELANIKRNAEAMAGKDSVVDDAVITIPGFYTADEKRAVVKAANFAGFNVLSLISDGLAVGLDYAKTRTFPEVTKGESPEYHLVYDMGAGSTTATIMRFQGRSVKDVGRFNKTVQEVSVQGMGWDRTLGGDALNHVIMDDLVKKLLTKPVLKSRGTTEQEIKSNGRIMARFFKEAERARQVLSANAETTVGFEEILPDIDLRVKITRANFEELAADFAVRVNSPIEDALAMAKLTMKDLKSIILHGGAVRTPFVQNKLESVVDDQGKLRSNVNADESAVLGAAFKAASLSPSFKVKEIRDSDVTVYATSLAYTDKGKERKQSLFGPQSPVGAGASTKLVSFKDKEDFSFGFVQSVGGVERSVLQVTSGNLTASVDQLKKKFGCEKEDINTKFSVKMSPQIGLPDVVSGSVSCEVDDKAKSGSVGDSVKGWLGLGKKKDQEPLSDGELDDGPVEKVDATPSSASSSATGTSTSTSETASASPKKRTESIPLRWSSRVDGNPQPEQTELVRMADRLKAFDASDSARLDRDEAQNVLESYTYQVRDFLENSDFQAVSTSAQREQLSKLLQSTKEWMEENDLMKASKDILAGKYQGLKDLVEPIKARRTEESRRPEVIKALQKTLDQTQKLIVKIQGQIDKAKSSAAASLSSTTSSSIAPTPSNDADDLEEPDSTSSVSTPETSDEPNPLISLDLTSFTESYEASSEWLKSKIAEQGKLKSSDEPVLLVKDIEQRAGELGRVMSELTIKVANLKKAKKAKPPAKPKPNKQPKKGSSETAEEPVPLETPVVDVPEGSEGDTPPEPAPGGTSEQKFDKPVSGDESIEDMMGWLKKERGGKPHDEL